MVAIATITHKNQLTIPQKFLEQSNLKGVKKVLLEKRGAKILLKPLRSKVEELAGSLHDPKRKPISRKGERQEVQKLITKEIAQEGL